MTASEGADASYLLTWVCYGAWLPGQDGAVPRTRNQYGAPLPEPHAGTESHSRNHMTHKPYLLDGVRGQIVLQSLQDLCSRRGWTLWAAHVRTKHVHAVATASSKPEYVMIAMKAESSRALNRYRLDAMDCRRWARHGSTRYLWTEDAVKAAIRYVVHEQGNPMAIFERSTPH